MSEKTEQPTAKKLRDAEAQGQLPRSRLLNSAVIVTAGLWAVRAFADSTVALLSGWTSSLLSAQDQSPHAALIDAVQVLLRCCAPVLLATSGAAVAVNLVTVGFQFNPGLLTPKVERVAPFAGFKRLFTPQQLFEVIKGLAVTALMLALVWSSLKDGAAPVLRAVSLEGTGAIEVVFALLGPAVQRAAIVLCVLGTADFALARRRHLRQLMMTKEETKQEHKQSDGDPQQKAKRKSLHRQLAGQGPARGVHKATAVVVNPTHIAVAIRFDETECDAPYIVGKAREEDALKLRKEAKDLGVPVVKDVPLARALIHYDVGEEIPEELYKAAAAVLKVAMEADRSPRGQTR